MAHLCDIVASPEGRADAAYGLGGGIFETNLEAICEAELEAIRRTGDVPSALGNLCLSRSAESPGGVQADVGQSQVAGGAQVIPGSIAYYPCPSQSTWFKVQAVMHGCCPPGWSTGHQDHHQHGCACGTHPCSC